MIVTMKCLSSASDAADYYMAGLEGEMEQGGSLEEQGYTVLPETKALSSKLQAQVLQKGYESQAKPLSTVQLQSQTLTEKPLQQTVQYSKPTIQLSPSISRCSQQCFKPIALNQMNVRLTQHKQHNNGRSIQEFRLNAQSGIHAPDEIAEPKNPQPSINIAMNTETLNAQTWQARQSRLGALFSTDHV